MNSVNFLLTQHQGLLTFKYLLLCVLGLQFSTSFLANDHSTWLTGYQQDTSKHSDYVNKLFCSFLVEVSGINPL